MDFEIKEFNYVKIDLKNKTKGQIKTTCPFCSQDRTHKHDACLSVNIDTGLYTCHHCGKSGNMHKFSVVKQKEYKVPYYHYNDDYPIEENVVKFFADRGISKETMKHLKIDYEHDIFFPQAGKTRGAIVFPYFLNGVCINKKFRSAKKEFTMVKDAQKTFFNIDHIADTEDVIIHEGEFDVCASVEAGIWNAISVPNGATKGIVNLDYLDDCYDTHFKDKKKIILAGDNDEPGRNLMLKLAERLGKSRCWTVDWKDCKDGNEYLIKYGKEEYKKVIEEAEPFPISGVYTAKTFEAKLLDEWEHGTQKGSPCHIQSLEEHFSWLKKDVYVFAGYPNMGKTEFLYFLCMLKSIHSGWKWSIAAFEDKTGDRFFRKLVEMYVGMRIDPSEVNLKLRNQMSQNQLKEAIDFCQSHFFYVRPDGSFTRKAIFEAFDYTVARYGVDGTIIDPFNKVVKERINGLRDDELLIDYYREYEQFAVDHNTVSITVTHLNKPEKLIGDVIPMPNAFSVLGGQATNNAVDELVFIHRLSSEITDKTRTIKIAKVRDRDIVGIPGEVNLDFDYKSRRWFDMGNDPVVGYNLQSKRTMPLPYKDNNDLGEDIDYCPF